MPSFRSLYWDSCVFLSLINDIPNRAPVIDELLRQSKKKEVRIYTSADSMVEVAFGAQEQAGKALSPEVEALIDGFWDDVEAITVVEFQTFIAAEARRIMRDGIPKGWSLKPMDAIHLATAKRLAAANGINISEVHTYDDWERYAPEIGIKICEPYIPEPPLPFQSKNEGGGSDPPVVIPNDDPEDDFR